MLILLLCELGRRGRGGTGGGVLLLPFSFTPGKVVGDCAFCIESDSGGEFLRSKYELSVDDDLLRCRCSSLPSKDEEFSEPVFSSLGRSDMRDRRRILRSLRNEGMINAILITAGPQRFDACSEG